MNARRKTSKSFDWAISLAKSVARSSWKMPAPQATAMFAAPGASARAALHAAALAAPAQHAARQVGDGGEARFLQDGGGMRRAAAGAAHRDDRLVLGQLLGPGRE